MNAKPKKISSSTRTKAKQANTKKHSTRNSELENFKLGDNQTQYPDTYSPEVLEAFENKNPQDEAWTTFVCTEFTSLCPKTGQPDFAKIFINYVADKKMVESKSLKLYLFSFRNHGDFHEDCIQKICRDLTKLMRPKFIEVIGEFTPRGGVAIFPYASASNSLAKFKKLKQERFSQYSPGKYSVELARLYS